MIGLARVSITPSASPSVYGYEVEARKSNGASPPAYSEWRPSKTADAESVDGSGRIIVDVSPLDVGGVYQFRVRADGPGSMSDWVGSGDVSISTDSDAPSSPTGVTASGGVGEITVNIVMPTEPDANRWRIYSGASSSFGSASLDDTRYELPGRADVHTVTAPAGTRYVWVTALDRSGNESAEQASTPASVTVT